MNSVFDHYNNHLAEHYSWMFGGYNATVENFIKYFLEKNIMPFQNKQCIDLGSGSGFQSIALAQIGFDVKAIDFNRTLLNELEEKRGNLKIETIEGDINNFSRYVNMPFELIVCMGDTLTHLNSKEGVTALIINIAEALSEKGKFILSYRDLSNPLAGKERFIPVMSDDEKIFTCFLEGHEDFVEVFDIINLRSNGKWEQKISSYKKLTLPEKWVEDRLLCAGFSVVEKETVRGMIHIIAEKITNI